MGSPPVGLSHRSVGQCATVLPPTLCATSDLGSLGRWSRAMDDEMNGRIAVAEGHGSPTKVGVAYTMRCWVVNLP